MRTLFITLLAMISFNAFANVDCEDVRSILLSDTNAEHSISFRGNTDSIGVVKFSKGWNQRIEFDGTHWSFSFNLKETDNGCGIYAVSDAFLGIFETLEYEIIDIRSSGDIYELIATDVERPEYTNIFTFNFGF